MQPTKVIGQRVAAVVIDYVLLFAFNSIVFFLMAKTEEELLREAVAGDLELTDTLYGNVNIGDHEYSIVGGDFLLYLLITTVVGILYWWVLPGLKGWTLGKRLLGIRVVRDDGTCPAGVGKNAIRQLMWIVDDFPYIIPGLTGFIVALTNPQNKRVGDMVAGTLVVRANAVGQLAPGGAQAAAAAPAAAARVAAPAQPVAPQPAPVAPQPAPVPPQPAPVPPQPAPAEPQPASAAPAQPADWYPDPQGQKRLRYWDGERWTENTAD